VRSLKRATVREAALFLEVVRCEHVSGVDVLNSHQSAAGGGDVVGRVPGAPNPQ
jgi:hypothetical protein